MPHNDSDKLIQNSIREYLNLPQIFSTFYGYYFISLTTNR